MLPLLIPAIVLSLSLLVASVLTGLNDAPLRLWAAHSVVVLPYVVRTCLASLGGMPRQVEEAARVVHLGVNGHAAHKIGKSHAQQQRSHQAAAEDAPIPYLPPARGFVLAAEFKRYPPEN